MAAICVQGLARWSPTAKAQAPAVPGVDVDKLAATIMNVGQYRGNIDYVEEVAPADARFNPPQSVRFQRVKVPMLAQPDGARDHGLG